MTTWIDEDPPLWIWPLWWEDRPLGARPWLRPDRELVEGFATMYLHQHRTD